MPNDSPAIQLGRAADGRLVYLVDQPPTALPPVTRRDLEAAWSAARDAAVGLRPGVFRTFLFHGPDGTECRLSLEDGDARCWAGAVERLATLATAYGLSLCLRLLALVDLLGRAGWATEVLRFRRDGSAELPPRLFRLAAAAPLTVEARFDEPALRTMLFPGVPA